MTLKHLLTSLLLLFTFLPPCYATGKLALVIGNSDYAEAPLNNPTHDSRDMAQALRGLGFEVIERENQNQEGMNTAVREFGDRLHDGMIGIFYYAGHGMQVKGKNYLIPVQSGIRREDEAPYRAFDVNQLLAKMESAHNGLNLVILDACRNNPFERSFRSGEEGLAPMDAPTGTLIAYAAKPGTKSKDSDASGKNGLYTGTLLKYINTMPYLKIEELLKKVRIDVKKASSEQQATWEEGGLESDFCFSTCGQSASPIAPEPAPIPSNTVDNARIELEFWNSVKDNGNAADFQAYLQQYPSGKFLALAQNRLARLQMPVAPYNPPATDGWQTIDRYQVKGGLVKDTQTGLMWRRCSSGQTWRDSTCKGKADSYTRQAALEMAKHDNGEGYSDWRLPTHEELLTLVYCSSGEPSYWNSSGKECRGNYKKPTIFNAAFLEDAQDDNAYLFWSSLSNANDSSYYPWIVNFNDGYGYYDAKNGIFTVRLVRAGQ